MTYSLLEPWTQEPDYAEFTLNGFTCVIRRPFDKGHLCGYVGLPEGHKSFGSPYAEIEVDIHGGLTYASHDVAEYNGPGLWWIGFDCDHYGDYSDDDREFRFLFDSVATYKTFGYVFAQLQSLTSQLQETKS